MKELAFIILSINLMSIENTYRQHENRDRMYKCKVYNCVSQDTGTLYITDGCLEVGDTIKLYEEQRRNTK